MCVVVRQVDDLAIRENLFHAGFEDLPLVVAPEIVAHEESAAQQEIAHAGGLRIGQFPVTRLDRVQPRPVVDVVFVVQIHRLLDRARVDSR